LLSSTQLVHTTPNLTLPSTSTSFFNPSGFYHPNPTTSSKMPPKAAEKKPTTGGKAPAGKAPTEKKEAGKKTAAAPSGEKKKRGKTRKETYSSYIYKGMSSSPRLPVVASCLDRRSS
jgi:hypothetical protein